MSDLDFGAFDYDPVTKIYSAVHDLDETHVGYESKQDVTELLEANKLFYNSTDERARYGEHFTRMASIDLVTWFRLVREGIADDEVALKKWLNDSDYNGYRTRPGRI